MRLRAPFPYFGGKGKIADLVWQRLGPVRNFIEPFAGSAAVLLARPDPPQVETINDADGYVANFWRAIQQWPDAVAGYADWPVSEADMHARHRWLTGLDWPEPVVPDSYLKPEALRRAYLAGYLAGGRHSATYGSTFTQRVKTDPHFYDPKIAGWWVWGMCCWIGAGWCMWRCGCCV